RFSRDWSSDVCSSDLPGMPRWSQLAAIYALLGIAAGAVAMFWRGTPWAHPEPWLRLSPAAAHLYSALLGLTVGLGVAMSTRPLRSEERRVGREGEAAR